MLLLLINTDQLRYMCPLDDGTFISLTGEVNSDFTAEESFERIVNKLDITEL